MLTCVCCRYTEPGSSLSQAPEGDLESYFKGSSTYFSPGLQYSGVQTGETRANAVHSGISGGSNGLYSLSSRFLDGNFEPGDNIAQYHNQDVFSFSPYFKR